MENQETENKEETISKNTSNTEKRKSEKGQKEREKGQTANRSGSGYYEKPRTTELIQYKSTERK